MDIRNAKTKEELLNMFLETIHTEGCIYCVYNYYDRCTSISYCEIQGNAIINDETELNCKELRRRFK